MTYLVLGLSVLIGLGLMGRWLLNAEPRVLLKILKWGGLIVLGLVGLFILFRGRLDYVVYAATVVLPFLFRWRGVLQAIRNAAKTARGPSPGQSSDVRTRYLAMTLDHDSGEMAGEVIAGTFAGARLDQLSPAQLSELHAEVSDDPRSVQVLEAWIERVHGEDWRAEEEPSETRSGADEPEMTRAYALSILGLSEGASESEIREAHRRLMMANHPDKGGSSVIASQINRAKDYLIGK
ncbi:MAG: DnaJ domain-containing protein [Alphaproteobacteria bacterium]|nr:DnaJ domain-containing protein [Alphaproteobacteria bacterium]